MKKTKLKDFALYSPRPLTDKGRELEEKSQVIFSAIVKQIRGRVKTNRIRKINLKINSLSPNEFTQISSFLDVHIKGFDIDQILSFNVDKQKSEIINLGISCLENVFQAYDLEGVCLKEIKSSLKCSAIENTYSGAFVEHEGDKARMKAIQKFENTSLFVELKRAGEKSVEKFLFDVESTNPFIFGVYLKKLEWESSTVLKLSTVTGEVHFLEL